MVLRSLDRSGLHRPQLVQVIWFSEVLRLKTPPLCCGDFRNTREPAENLQRTCRGQRDTAVTSSGSADQYLMKEEKKVALEPRLCLSVLVNSSPPFASGTCSSVFLTSSWKIHPHTQISLPNGSKGLPHANTLSVVASRGSL